MRVAVLWDPATGTFHLPALHAEAVRLRVALNVLEVGRPEDLDNAFESARDWRAEALNVLASPMLWAHRKLIMHEVAVLHLPAIYQFPEMAEEGGLAAYGPRITEVGLQLARQIAQVFRGIKITDIPVEQPSQFELWINLKTANALGVTVPASLLARADKVIE